MTLIGSLIYWFWNSNWQQFGRLSNQLLVSLLPSDDKLKTKAELELGLDSRKGEGSVSLETRKRTVHILKR